MVENMSIVNVQDVMKLRQETKLGLMKCKAALEEANGDMALAEMNLRKEGLAGSDAPEDHEFSEGCIAVALNEDSSKCAIVEINTQTDFTAWNETFVAMAADLARLAFEQHAGQIEKTAEMQDRIDQLRSTTRENVSWRRGIVLEGGRIGTYIHHDRKTGVAVQIEGSIDDVMLHQLCLHVASADPAPLSASRRTSFAIRTTHSLTRLWDIGGIGNINMPKLLSTTMRRSVWTRIAFWHSAHALIFARRARIRSIGMEKVP